MTNIEDLRRAATHVHMYSDEALTKLLNDAADVIEDLCKHIDGCVRVAADALKRAEANHPDTGGPDQGGEFKRGMPGHPDNDMGM
jgi:hypothetical protein